MIPCVGPMLSGVWRSLQRRAGTYRIAYFCIFAWFAAPMLIAVMLRSSSESVAALEVSLFSQYRERIILLALGLLLCLKEWSDLDFKINLVI